MSDNLAIINMENKVTGFIAGTKVLTSNGYKNIEDLNVGDLVLTHKNRYRKITKINTMYKQQIWEVRTLCEKTFYTAINTKFFVSEVEETHYTDSAMIECLELPSSDYLVGFMHNAKYGEMGCAYYIYDIITSVIKTDIYEDVYNLEVNEDNTYLVNDRIVGGIEE